MTVAIADLDHFKKFNDTYGDPFSDRVVQTFAETMHACARVAAKHAGRDCAKVAVKNDWV
jgi:diguanylate cyclase (GGDEF)-like protein